LSDKFKGGKKKTDKGNEGEPQKWSEEVDLDELLKNLKSEVKRKSQGRNHTYDLIHSDLERRKKREKKLGRLGLAGQGRSKQYYR